MNIKSDRKPIIWTISGADCSGGAGIAADTKTGHGLGVEVCQLITANTVQNSDQLVSINPTNVAILQAQLDCLIEDKPPKIIKVGLLASIEQVNWLVGAIKQIKFVYPTAQVVYDPVGQASVGGKFSTITSHELLPLLAITDVLTPNLIEAQQLIGTEARESSLLAAQLIALGVKQVIVKGGHGADPQQCTDYCYSSLTGLEYQLTSERVSTCHSHGGGCSFAAALSSFLAHGYLLRDAFTLAKAFIQQGLKAKEGQTAFYGAFEQLSWPVQQQYFPLVEAPINRQYPELEAFSSLGINREGQQGLGLYPVVDSVEWLKRLMPLGIKIIQLRLKNKTNKELHQQIKMAVELSHSYDCRLFINDYWHLAVEYGAYGVHIGQEDLLDADLSKIQAAGLRLGISTHGCYEFLLAQQLRPSYLAIGAIFPTKTKDMTGQIQGISNLVNTLILATDIPVVAIGGITHDNVKQVWQTEVDSVAVVTAITEADDYREAVNKFNRLLVNIPIDN